MPQSIALMPFICLLSLCVLCGGTQEPPQPPRLKIETFVPSAPTATEAQLLAWQTCNPLLDSLSRAFNERLQVEDATVRKANEKAFRAAQDTVCALTGLSGGYAEYLWIAGCLPKQPESGTVPVETITD